MHDRIAGVPIHSRQTGPLIGREAESAALRSALDLALHRDGQLVLISGEAGIGKSTLVESFIHEVTGLGLSIAVGTCHPAEESRAYGPWQHVATQLQATGDARTDAVPAGGVDLMPAESQTEVFAAFTARISDVSARGPCLIVLEDLHWADTASIELLRYIGRRIRTLPVLLIGTFREDEPGATFPLFRLLPDLVRETAAQRLQLRRLSRADVRALVDQDYALVDPDAEQLTDYLHQRAEGNPFFTGELLRDLEGGGLLACLDGTWALQLAEHPDVPLMVRQVIESRLARLSRETRALLDIASVIGYQVPVDLWLTLSGVEEETLSAAIEEAVQGHVLIESPDGERVQFCHGLIRETLYRSRAGLRRKRQHRQIAEALSVHHRPEPEPVAYHFSAAGDARAVDWLIEAGGQALRLYAAQDAITSLSRAIELADTLGLPCPCDALRLRAQAYQLLGRLDAARDDLDRMLDVAEQQGDRDAIWQARFELGSFFTGSDYTMAGRYLTEALDLATEIGDQGKLGQTLNRLGNCMANMGRFDDAATYLRQALDAFDTLNDADGIATTLDLLGSIHLLAGNYAESVRYLDRSIERSRRLNDRMRLSSSLSNLALNGGDFDVSFDAGIASTRPAEIWTGYAQEGLEIAREIGWKSGEAFALTMLGAIVALRGDLGRGLSCLNEAHEIAQRIGHQQWMVASSLVTGSLWAEMLDPSRARYHFERSRALAEELGSFLWNVLLDTSLAVLHAESGDSATAFELLQRCQPADDRARSHTDRAWRYSMVRVRLAAGEPDAALQLADLLLSFETGRGDVRGIPQVLRLKADALAALGRWPDAVTLYEQASFAAEQLDYQATRWRIYAHWGRACVQLGDDTGAESHRRLAEAIVERMAATIRHPDLRTQFSERAGRVIAEARPRERRRSDPFDLSSRQLDVLRLVAQGLTDAQVADQLYISPRTVARHLQTIYTKLGVNSRMAAVARAWERNLIDPPR
jgi:DNA-binding CsgD family transcriptional regulator/tetratricopeptide (TPR) repeat protein